MDGRKLAAEFVGTALLVIFAVGAATLSFGFKLAGAIAALAHRYVFYQRAEDAASA